MSGYAIAFQSGHEISIPDTFCIEANYDYSTGEPRRHHTFYFEQADIYIQVNLQSKISDSHLI
jgi:hypothetical protein